MVIPALLASLLAGLATGVGGCGALILRESAGRKVLDHALGVSAGIMLAATMFSLLIPAIDEGGILPAAGGLLLGVATILLFERWSSKFWPGMTVGVPGLPTGTWLLIVAITVHNFPEGLAVGVVYGSGEPQAGALLAMAIGIQNIPEGLAVALPLMREGWGRGAAVRYATLTGLVEPLAGFLGAVLAGIGRATLPWFMSFAAGAMLYVISGEMIPETHRAGNGREATIAMVLGFLLMMVLDKSFG